MSHDTLAPPPYEIAADTWVIPELFPAGPDAFVPINSMVIAGAEPVIVDTGTKLNEQRWLEAVGSIVDFADVRWIFISHDDHDHTGNLERVLELAPKATLVSTWFQLERLAGDIRPDLSRVRWIRDGESFDAGDRVLHAVRPPIFDSPTTRGLFDPTTGVYWASDAFANLVPGHIVDNDDVPEPMWEETFLHINRLVSPWHTMLDPQKYNALIDRFTALGATVVAAAHTTANRGERLARGVELLRTLPSMDEAVEPGQLDLEAMLTELQAA
jgi:flavorubredoxin